MITMINDARLAVGKGPVGEFHGLSTKLYEGKCPYFDPQASSIPQFTPVSLQMRSTILPLGSTQAVVCVIIQGKLVILRRVSKATDGFTAYVYARGRVQSVLSRSTSMKCKRLGSRHRYAALPAFSLRAAS